MSTGLQQDDIPIAMGVVGLRVVVSPTPSSGLAGMEFHR
jgi:hypothetical protein